MAGRAAERMLRAIGGSGYEDDEDLLLLNGRGAEGGEEEDEDELDEQNVLDVMGEDEDEDEEEEEEEGEGDGDEEEEEEEDEPPLKGYAAKLARQAELLRRRPELQQDEDEEEEEEGEEEDEGMKGSLWGKKKSAFYSADTVDYEIASDDEATPGEEEEEALRLQRAMDAALRPEDYEQEGEEEEEVEEGEEGTMEERVAGGEGARTGAEGKRKKGAPKGGIEVEKVEKDPTAQSLAAMESELPELMSLLSDLKAASGELQHKLTPLLSQVRQGGYVTAKGLSYLEAKHALLLHYCSCLLFFLLLKSEGRPVHNHPVLARLVELRLYLEKIRPIDKRLQYQLEKLLRSASGAPAESGRAKAGEEDDDALKYRPNPASLVAKDGADGALGGEPGAYRPPKIAPASMDADELRAQGARGPKLPGAKGGKKGGESRSAFLKELAEELEGRPEEIEERAVGRAGGVASAEMERELQRLHERAEEEERLFARVPLKRDERKRLKALRRQQHSSVGGMLEDFEDDVGDLVAAEPDDVDASGALPDPLRRKKLADAIAEVDQLNRLALPKTRAAGQVSGDADLPSRPDLAERRRAFDVGYGSKKRRRGMGGDEEGEEGEEGGAGRGDGEEEEDDEFYAQVRDAKAAKRQAKLSRTSGQGVIPQAEPEADGKRSISYQMEKNRGLTPHRNKEMKNPRKKYKLKHAKAVVRRKGQVREARTEVSAYGGESTGIKAGISRSVRMGGR